jgi:hypothetical protein
MVEALIGDYIFSVVGLLVLVALAVAYVSLRIRDARVEHPDPELGIKTGYHAFLTTGVLLALTGLSIAVIDLLADAFEGNQNQPQQPQFQPQFNPQFGKGGFPQPQPQPPMRVRNNDDLFSSVSQRLAWPLVISGVLFSFIALLLIRLGTNDLQYPSVRRTFGGVRLVVGGMTVMAAAVLIIELLFQKDLATTRPYAIGVGTLAIWFPAAAIQLFMLKRLGGLPYYVPPRTKAKKNRWEDDEDEDEDRRKPHRRRETAEEPEPHSDEDARPPERRRTKPPREEDERA